MHANLEIFESLQNEANTKMGILTTNVFNAEFAGIADLTLEQRKQIQPYKDAVLEAERAFRAADDIFIQEEKQYKEELERIKKQLQPITSKRLAAANMFEYEKASIEAPLSEYGVSVIWDEPQVDVNHIDLEA